MENNNWQQYERMEAVKQKKERPADPAPKKEKPAATGFDGCLFWKAIAVVIAASLVAIAVGTFRIADNLHWLNVDATVSFSGYESLDVDII